jgi:hypothetical protein
VTTLLLLLLVLLVLQALGAPPATRRSRGPVTSWGMLGRRLVGDVVNGARTLSRLDAARRDRLGRPWS